MASNHLSNTKQEPKQSQDLSQEMVEAFASLFKGRTDCWGEISTPTGKCVYETITLQHYRRHLKGETSLGVYFNLDDSTCYSAAIDIDDFSFDKAKAVRAALRSIGIPAYIASSKRNRFHVYLFAEDRFNSREIRRILIHVRDELGIKTSKGSPLEVFPKQDEHHPDDPPSEKHPNGKKYPGSYINLPCFGATRPFLAVDDNGAPKEVPLEVALEQIKRTPDGVIQEILKTIPEESPKKETKRPKQEYKERSREFNELAITKLLEGCAFLQHCRDEATTLFEPKWWSMCAILSFFGELGKAKAHELSKPYPKYTEAETNQKLEYAKEAADEGIGPHLCSSIQEDINFECPADCLAKKWGLKSPVVLAYRLAAPKVFNLTDLGNAERLIRRHGENIRYSEERKRWLIWNGDVWEWDFGAKIMGLAKETTRNILREAADENDDTQHKELIKHAARSEGEARLTAMVTLAQSEPGIPVQSKALNSNPWLFNCSNGTLDLRTGELLPHNRGDLLTIISPVSYDRHAPRTLWSRFLDRVTGGSKELTQYLQRAVGYSLTGDMRVQVMFFLFGLGNNGKSTFIGIIRKIMAGYGAKAPVDMFLARDKNARGPREDLANLQGKRFIAASEVEVGRKLAVVIIKEMTGGEAIRADRKYEHEIEFQPTHKLWISGNHKPVIVDTSLAIWRRIKLIPFTVTIPDDEIDEDLPFKMEAELSGILAWAVEGCLSWQQSGLTEPREVTAATLAYRSEEDILAEFIQDCCSLKATATVPKADLHESYKQWCEATGNQPVYQKTLRTRLMERGITEGKSGSVRYWRGITLTEGKEEGHLGQEEKEGHLGQETTFFQENSIREEIQGKVPGNRSSAVPPVPTDAESDELTKDTPDYPHEKCPTCGGDDFWLTEDNKYLCSRCHSEPKGVSFAH